MKKIALLLSLFIVLKSNVYAQIDSLIYFDFADSIPQGWLSTDLNGNNFNWLHATEGLEAVYNPALASDLNSASSENGWMMFHAAFYNTDTNGVLSQIEPLVYMNCVFTSPSFNFSEESSVFLSLSHYFQTLSAPMNGSLELGISTDSINWSVYDLHTGSDSPLNIIDGIEQISIDISQYAALEEHVWIRFHFRNLAWHFWNIDDVLFSKNELISANLWPSFSNVNGAIYPNPIVDFALIERSCQYSKFKIYSIDGTHLKDGFSSDKIDFSDIKTGTYIIELESCKKRHLVLKQ